MCGLAGIIGDIKDREHLLNKMLLKQNHRGPDYRSTWSNSKLCLGHNRLSIIDLSFKANQPMVSLCGNFVIVFNGEIYNYLELRQTINDYKFITNSDTEVLLALYIKFGKEMLSMINGMFSFVIYNRIENKIFGARDRFGVKPLFYSFLKGTFYFASEIKTLWEAGITKIMNKKVWSNYICYGTYGMPHETFWDNIHQIKPGNYFEYKIHCKNFKETKYYDFVKNIKLINYGTDENFEEKYLSLLEESIKLRFRSDVPVGFSLSGGVDSSILLAMVNKIMYQKSDTIEAFTFYSNDSRYDELIWAEEMTKNTKNHHNKILLKVDEIDALFKDVSYHQDEPFGGIPVIAYSKIFKKCKDKGIKVILDGQGMDEAWAGYDYYTSNSDYIIQGTKTNPFKPNVLIPEFLNYSAKDLYSKPFKDDLLNLQFRDLFYTKIPRALRFNDRISMMHSTELREPFLDFRLVELAFSQPKEMKIKNGQGKWMLRKIAKNLVGNSVSYAPKRPLQTPQREWLSTELKEWVELKLKKFANLDFIDKKVIYQLWNEYQLEDKSNSFFLWQWINMSEL